jgi:undecaprenyl diphosphate synthase
VLKRKLKQKEINLLEKVRDQGNIPQHIAIIMDGNGRWARKRKLPRVAGHQYGIETVRNVVEACTVLGVKYLTLYTFSTENWKRPVTEVSTLMRLIVKSLQSETNELHANNIKLKSIGETCNLPEDVQKELLDAEEKTKDNAKMVLNLALSYSGRREITEAVKKIAEDAKTGKLKSEINEQLISNYLYTKDIPDPDLVIRSGGEHRVSNFLLWQIAYSEIYVTDLLWPDFGTEALIDAIKDYKNRERRFGLVSEQISKNSKKTQNVGSLPKSIA